MLRRQDRPWLGPGSASRLGIRFPASHFLSNKVDNQIYYAKIIVVVLLRQKMRVREKNLMEDLVGPTLAVILLPERPVRDLLHDRNQLVTINNRLKRDILSSAKDRNPKRTL